MPDPQLDNASVALIVSLVTGLLLPVIRWLQQKRKEDNASSVEMVRAKDATTLTAAEQWRDIAERMEEKWNRSEERITLLETKIDDNDQKILNLTNAFEYLAREVEATHATAVSIARAKAAGVWPPASQPT